MSGQYSSSVPEPGAPLRKRTGLPRLVDNCAAMRLSSVEMVLPAPVVLAVWQVIAYARKLQG